MYPVLLGLLVVGGFDRSTVAAGSVPTPDAAHLGTLSPHEFTLAVGAAEDAQAKVTGTFVGATAFASDGRVRALDERGCPDVRLVHVRLVWRADASFDHAGVPGGPTNGLRKAQLLTLGSKTGEVCSWSSSYRDVGALPDETLLYGTRP